MDGPMIDRQQSWSNAGMKMSSYLRRLRFLVEDTCGVELSRFDAVLVGLLLETSDDRVVVGYIVAGALSKQPLTLNKLSKGNYCRGPRGSSKSLTYFVLTTRLIADTNTLIHKTRFSDDSNTIRLQRFDQFKVSVASSPAVAIWHEPIKTYTYALQMRVDIP